MALRRQLLLMASLTLALPWAGCEYVREMENSLRQGQQAALAATAHAVAARIAADRELSRQLQQALQSLDHEQAQAAFYAHALKGPVVVDGYSDDWRSFGLPPQSLGASQGSASVTWGQQGGLLYGLLVVRDDNRQFFDPSRPLRQSDYLELMVGPAERQAPVRIYSAAPGTATVERRSEEGVWQREHRVVAVWNESEDAYALELRLPLPWALDGVKLTVNDGAAAGVIETTERRALITPDTTFDATLAVFARSGVRLALVTDGGWILGSAGQLRTDSEGSADDGAGRWLVRRILGQPQMPPLDDALTQGRFAADLVQQTPGSSGGAWYRWGESLVGRTVVPVDLQPPSAVPFVIVAEQSMDSVEALTTGAVGRLMMYSLLATGLAGATLLLYASVLSWRIRRLSRAAQQAVDSDGRIRGTLPASRSRDEIGDLARSYEALLQRLQHYTQYLESLAGKLSHELRTPLAIVRSSLDNLDQVAAPDEQRIYINRASDGLQRLSNILNAMSAAARLEQTLHQSELETFDCRDLFGLLVQGYQDIYAPRRLEFLVVNDGPFRVHAAPELLAQMCDKLVENAADFTGGSGLIQLTLRRLEQEVCLQVINTGPALPEQLEERIFDSLTSVRVDGGHHLGLGLYVVRLIVQFHKGRVRAFNHPEGGRVVFEVRFPAV